MTIPGFFEGTEMPDPDWWEALWPEPSKVLSLSGVRSEMFVVDLCCGDGWFTLQIARMARSVVAIDIDAKLLETARVRLFESGATNCRFINANAYDLADHVRDPADHVFLANAFHGVSDRPRLSSAVHSILKPGGLFAVVNWYPRPREETAILGEPRGPATELRMSPDQTRKDVEPSGFKLRERADVSPYHYASVFECVA